ncbi:threonine synthase [Hyphomonas johnsonii]|uniref:Threonine synthase n=1 Tax=Hyphomonas johnsonii MHS-2 TaxID=1280950 RepID=A0A059FTT8_9PROT|nr:threonine synthase [Hyphomonas johnsonii]KCZ93883.1 threonine synthase [Hyphomonas johnsonii MHS-2]
MKYVSTRGQAAPVDFVGACLAGLAPDGGLYVPESYPRIDPARADEPYAHVAARILSAFAGDAIPEADMLAMCERAYASFSHHSVAPLTQAGPGLWLMELHHGPTLAFKDVAMQIIAQLYDYMLGKTGRRLSIVCATSGDTGGAAAAAFAGAKHADLFILHPHARISPVQRLFMTTTGASNVTNLALDGDFDDCQAIVKSLFADKAFADKVGLSGVNSINWARIAAQTVYYATAQAALGGKLRFVVPSGNMGDALAGYVAARCGLLAGGLEIACAVNENDALARLFNTGIMSRAAAVATPSPAMDISVPSNFERLLFEATGRDGDAVRGVYDQYRQAGEAGLPDTARGRLDCVGISASTVSNGETLAEMARFESETGWLICPHTAVGTYQARQTPRSDVNTVVLATAAAAKFPETVKQATGLDAPLPHRCGALLARGEVFERLPAEPSAVRAAIESKRRAVS